MYLLQVSGQFPHNISHQGQSTHVLLLTTQGWFHLGDVKCLKSVQVKPVPCLRQRSEPAIHTFHITDTPDTVYIFSYLYNHEYRQKRTNLFCYSEFHVRGRSSGRITSHIDMYTTAYGTVSGFIPSSVQYRLTRK